MPKSNPKPLSFNRTLKLDSSSNQINGNIFTKKETIDFETHNHISFFFVSQINTSFSTILHKNPAANFDHGNS